MSTRGIEQHYVSQLLLDAKEVQSPLSVLAKALSERHLYLLTPLIQEAYFVVSDTERICFNAELSVHFY